MSGRLIASSALRHELIRFVVGLLAAALLGWHWHLSWCFMLIVASLNWLRHVYALSKLRLLMQARALHQETAPATYLGALWEEVLTLIIKSWKAEERARHRLENVIERARTSIAALEEAVVLIDGRGNLEWWNPSAERILGLKASDRNQQVTNFLRDPRFVDYFKAGHYSEPLHLPSHIDHRRHLQYEITRFGSNDRLLICWDVTVLHKLEAMRKDFVANVSHELRTPLTVLAGYIEALQDQGDELPLRWSRALAQMQAQTQRMSYIVNDLLTLARLETTRTRALPGTVDVPAMLHDMRQDALAYGADKHQSIALDMDEQLLIHGVEEDLRSAFMNLLTNAVKYSPDDGHIVLRWYQDDAGLWFVVQDNGIGIDPRHHTRLTERFYRVDPGRSKAAGGTGLGLAIVKHVLLNHHASLHLKSALGQGCQFSVLFPAQAARRR